MNSHGGRMVITLSLMKIYISLYFSKGVKSNVIETNGDKQIRLKEMDTAILTHNFFFPWPYHTVVFRALHLYIFCSPARGYCVLWTAARTKVSRLKSDPCKTSRVRSGPCIYNFHNIHVFQLSPMWGASNYFHRCILQSHSLYSWNTWLCQRSIWNKPKHIWNKPFDVLKSMTFHGVFFAYSEVCGWIHCDLFYFRK